MAEDYYKVLGVPRDAPDDAIKRAYRKLARKYHPDVNKGAEAEKRFQAVSAAYDVLRDPEQRAAYDQHGKNWQTPPPRGDWSGGYGFAPEDMARADAGDFRDFFDAFRMGGFGGQPVQHVRLELALEEAFAGGRKTVELRLPDMDAQGRITWQTKVLALNIPKGVTEGQHLRLHTDGAELIAEIVLKPHPVFRVDGRDIFVDLPITPWEAALGARVDMPTPGGPVQIRVPPEARSGQKLRLKGRGLPGASPGDMYATLLIVNPPANTPEARAFYERMAREMSFDPRKTKRR